MSCCLLRIGVGCCVCRVLLLLCPFMRACSSTIFFIYLFKMNFMFGFTCMHIFQFLGIVRSVCLWSHTHPIPTLVSSQAMFKGAVFGWAHALCRNAMFGSKGVAASMPDWAIESLAGGMGGASSGRFFTWAIVKLWFRLERFLCACRFSRVVDLYYYPHRKMFCASQFFQSGR